MGWMSPSPTGTGRFNLGYYGTFHDLVNVLQLLFSPCLAKRGHLPARSRFGEGRGEIFIIDSLVVGTN